MAVTEFFLEIRGLKLVRERAGTEGREKRTIQGFQRQDKSGKGHYDEQRGDVELHCMCKKTNGWLRTTRRKSLLTVRCVATKRTNMNLCVEKEKAFSGTVSHNEISLCPLRL